jgi:hypothetical protein
VDSPGSLFEQLGRLWMVFFGGSGGGRGDVRTRQQGWFSLDDVRF